MPAKEERRNVAADVRPDWPGLFRSQSDARNVVLGLGIAVIVLVCVGVGFAIHELRLRDLREEQRTLSAIDLLLVEETEHTLQSVDLVLANVADKLFADHLGSAREFARRESDRITYDMLLSRMIGIPQLDVISIIGSDGQVINSTRGYPPASLYVADRDYFQKIKQISGDAAFVSEPVQSRATGQWTVYLGRAVTSRSGRFLGLVIGGIKLSYFEDLYKTLQIGAGGSVSLWRADGMLLARYPGHAGVGHVFASTRLASPNPSGGPTTLTVDNSVEGSRRLLATMAARQFPIIVNVSKSTGQILADWNQVAALMAAGTLLCIAALGFGVWLLLRQFKTYEALAEAHEARSKAIAEREQAEAQLRQAQKLESIGQLTGGIAHDFNNLLTAVLGNLELLRKHTDSRDSRLLRWANNAHDAANRGAVLTQRLLVFSRRQPLDPRATDVVTLLASMSDLLRRTLGENIEIVTEIEPGLWPAFSDLNQLDNAILNIAINARDAMDGRGRLTIAAANWTCDKAQMRDNQEIGAGDYVRLAISDTGKGIEREVLDRVFEPFFSTKPIGQGTGLGLSQVYGFVKQTGGHVQIHSEVGKGTRVDLYLPRAEQSDVVEIAPCDIETAVPGRGKGSILVVEDDADVRAYSAETLRELGFVVREAANAKAALELLRSDPRIDVLFSDVGLPGMTGQELMREALKLRPQLKVLLTTGYAQDSIIEATRPERGILLMAKPFGRADLAQKIGILLAPSTSQQCA